MQAGLPSIVPDRVAPVAATAFAMPKSLTLTVPSHDTSTLCGDTSRWTTISGLPSTTRSWPWPSPRSTAARTWTSTDHGSGPPLAS